MRGAVILAVALVACGGASDEPIGTTEWAVQFDRPFSAAAVSGSSGHVVAYNNQRAVLIAADGTDVLWDADLPNGGQDASAAIDSSGATYVAKPISDSRMVVFDKRATDGSEEWTQTLSVSDGGYALVHAVLVEPDDRVLLLINGEGAVDLGGGPVGEPGEALHSTWGRFDGDGTLLASGVIDFELRGQQASGWPDGDGFVVHALRFQREQLVAFDREGQEVWSVDGPSLSAPFCLHEDGEVSLVVGADLVRLDAQQRQRWRVAVPLLDCAPLVGGALIGSLGDIQPGCLEQVDAAGEVSDSECFDSSIAIAHGPTTALYHFQIRGTDGLDLHDLHLEDGGDYMVARRAPP